MIGYCAEHKDQRKDAFLAAITTDCPYCRIAELEQQLARYQGAVEVEGYLDLGGELHINHKESLKFKDTHGNVRVMIMEVV